MSVLSKEWISCDQSLVMAKEKKRKEKKIEKVCPKRKEKDES